MEIEEKIISGILLHFLWDVLERFLFSQHSATIPPPLTVSNTRKEREKKEERESAPPFLEPNFHKFFSGFANCLTKLMLSKEVSTVKENPRLLRSAAL